MVAIGPEASHTSAASSNAPRDADDALKLAIKLAVDTGDYERATMLINIAKTTMKKPASVTPVAVVRQGHDRND
jgi:hypothetical protein